MKRRTADNCSFTSNVSTSVLPLSKRIWIRVFEYDFGAALDDGDAADEVDDGSAIVTVSGKVAVVLTGFSVSLCV